MASVTLKHLDKKFPHSSHAVRDVSLQVRDGEFIVIVGPSGCGKSTILRMIAGLEEATAGEIYIADQMVNRVPSGLRDIAMVFQNYAMYPHMSVYQNIAFGLRMHGATRGEIDKRVREAARILSIESLLERRPAELSGGERQRAALGRAIVREPKLFLFDEPLSNLDAKLRVQMRAEIARLHQRLATTVIYVTHDQAEAMTLGERIAILDQGMIQQVDTPMNVYRRPANRFVASFIGSPAMNFLPGLVRSGRFRFTDSAQPLALLADPPAKPWDATREIDVGRAIADGPVVVGVRPEDLLPSRDGIALGDVTLQLVEHMGHEIGAHFSLAGNSHVARLPASAAVKAGDRMPLAIRPGTFHVFSADDGRRLN
jgi:multiple sugar transport system ATP-binding protein